jgi:hypothetical protein
MSSSVIQFPSSQPIQSTYSRFTLNEGVELSIWYYAQEGSGWTINSRTDSGSGSIDYYWDDDDGGKGQYIVLEHVDTGGDVAAMVQRLGDGNWRVFKLPDLYSPKRFVTLLDALESIAWPTGSQNGQATLDCYVSLRTALRKSG